MMCSKCKFEFCWTCLGSYKRYKHAEGFAKYCGQAHMLYGSIYLTIGLMLFGKLVNVCPWQFSHNFWPVWLAIMNTPVRELVYNLTLIVGANALFFGIAITWMACSTWRTRLSLRNEVMRNRRIIFLLTLVLFLLSDSVWLCFQILFFELAIAICVVPIALMFLFSAFTGLASLGLQLFIYLPVKLVYFIKSLIF